MSENPESREIEHYQALAEQLDKLQKTANNGQGIEYVRWIVSDLKQGNIGAAQVNYRNQSDKYGSFPEIVRFLEEAGIAEKRKPLV